MNTALLNSKFSVKPEEAFYWKKIQSIMFIGREENQCLVFKASKDRMAFLLGAKAAGDFKAQTSAHRAF